jgi:hypothetical protein
MQRIAFRALAVGILGIAPMVFASSPASAATNWSVSQAFGIGRASFTTAGVLSLTVGAQDTAANGEAVEAEVKIVSGGNETWFSVANRGGSGTTKKKSKNFDGANIGWSGHVQLRICKWRGSDSTGISWGCGSWASRPYNLG